VTELTRGGSKRGQGFFIQILSNLYNKEAKTFILVYFIF